MRIVSKLFKLGADVGQYCLTINKLRTIAVNEVKQVAILSFIVLFHSDQTSNSNPTHSKPFDNPGGVESLKNEMFETFIERLDINFKVEDFTSTLEEMSKFWIKNHILFSNLATPSFVRIDV